METIEKGVKYDQSWIWTYFTPSFSVSRLDFKEVNVNLVDFNCLAFYRPESESLRKGVVLV